MSYIRSENYMIYQRYVDSVGDGDDYIESYDYCAILWEQGLQFYADYAFEMIELLKMIELRYGYSIPQPVFDALERDCQELNERLLAQERQPSVYRAMLSKA